MREEQSAQNISPNQEEILLELLREGFRQLVAEMQQARTMTEDCEERVLRMGGAYWQFARSNPQLYQLMQGLGGIPLEAPERMLAVQEICAVTEDALTDWVQAADVLLADPTEAVEILWGLLHGLAILNLNDRIEGGTTRTGRLVRRAMQDLLTAWKVAKSNS